MLHASESAPPPLHLRSVIALTATQRDRFVRTLTPYEAQQLYFHWPFWARPEQLAPTRDTTAKVVRRVNREWVPVTGDDLDTWRVFVMRAGRGWGKSSSSSSRIGTRSSPSMSSTMRFLRKPFPVTTAWMSFPF